MCNTCIIHVQYMDYQVDKPLFIFRVFRPFLVVLISMTSPPFNLTHMATVDEW